MLRWGVVACLPLLVEPTLAVDTLTVGGSGIGTFDVAWEATGTLENLAVEGSVLITERLDPAQNALRDLTKRNGSVAALGIVGSVASVVDGNLETGVTFDLPRNAGGHATVRGRFVQINLGAVLPIDSIAVHGRGLRFMRAYDVFVHDGNPDELVGGAPVGKFFDNRVGFNPVQDDPVIELGIPLQFAKFIKIRNLSEEFFDVAEVEVFGDGFAPFGTYVSEVIDLGEPANFGEIFLPVRLDPLTAVALQTRTGTVPDPRVFYAEVESIERGGVVEVAVEPVGLPAAEAAYRALDPRDTTGTRDNLQQWSPWTAPYASLGGEFLSPGNRRYLQFRLAFTSTHVTQAAAVESFGVEFAIPSLAREIVGEIVPAHVVLGHEHSLDFHLRPDFDPVRGSPGFDRIRINTPFHVKLEAVVLANELLTEEDYVRIDPDDPAHLTVQLEGENRVENAGQTLTIRFRSLVTVYGTTFSGQVFDTQRGSGKLAQDVVPGDATAISDANRLSVHGDLGGSLLRDVLAGPRVFTPNGDSINDELIIQYVLLKALSQVPVELTVYDLSGRSVRRLRVGHAHGLQSISWDGLDDAGRLVAPGLYVTRLSVSTDTGTDAHTIIVGVAY